MRLRCLIGRVGLGEQELGGHRAHGFERAAGIRVGHRAGEREREPEVAIDRYERGAAGIAVQHAADLAGALFAQDRGCAVVGVKQVHDERALRRASGANLDAEQVFLRGGLVGPAVEPAFADRDRAAVLDRAGDRVDVELLGGASSGTSAGGCRARSGAPLGACERDQRRPGLRAASPALDRLHTGGLGASEHRFAIGSNASDV